MCLCVLLRDVISSQKLAFSADHCGKINLLLKVSKLVIIVTDRLFKTLPWLLFISIFYDSPWSIFTAIEQIKNDESNQALCWDKFGSDVTYLAVHETVNNREYQARFLPCGYQFFKKNCDLGYGPWPLFFLLLLNANALLLRFFCELFHSLFQISMIS